MVHSWDVISHTHTHTMTSKHWWWFGVSPKTVMYTLFSCCPLVVASFHQLDSHFDVSIILYWHRGTTFAFSFDAKIHSLNVRETEKKKVYWKCEGKTYSLKLDHLQFLIFVVLRSNFTLIQSGVNTNWIEFNFFCVGHEIIPSVCYQ